MIKTFVVSMALAGGGARAIAGGTVILIAGGAGIGFSSASAGLKWPMISEHKMAVTESRIVLVMVFTNRVPESTLPDQGFQPDDHQVYRFGDAAGYLTRNRS